MEGFKPLDKCRSRAVNMNFYWNTIFMNWRGTLKNLGICGVGFGKIFRVIVYPVARAVGAMMAQDYDFPLADRG